MFPKATSLMAAPSSYKTSNTAFETPNKKDDNLLRKASTINVPARSIGFLGAQGGGILKANESGLKNANRVEKSDKG